MADVTAAAVAAALEADEPLDAALAALKRDPAQAKDVFDELASAGRFFVRQWVALEAPAILGRRAVPLLLRLTRDRHEDVRMDAVNELVELDREAAAQLAPALRRQLRSRDVYEPIVAMRALMLVGDTEDADEMRRAAAESDYPFHRLAAGAYALALEGDDEELARRIEAHQHDAMPWLVVAAAYRATPPMVEALRLCARGPCHECRDDCSKALAGLRAQP
jgi:hypothetical protein